MNNTTTKSRLYRSREGDDCVLLKETSDSFCESLRVCVYISCLCSAPTASHTAETLIQKMLLQFFCLHQWTLIGQSCVIEPMKYQQGSYPSHHVHFNTSSPNNWHFTFSEAVHFSDSQMKGLSGVGHLVHQPQTHEGLEEFLAWWCWRPLTHLLLTH